MVDLNMEVEQQKLILTNLCLSLVAAVGPNIDRENGKCTGVRISDSNFHGQRRLYQNSISAIW